MAEENRTDYGLKLITAEWRGLLLIVLALGLWHGPTLILAPGVNHDEVALNAAARNWSQGGAASLSLLADRGDTYARAYYWQPPGLLWVVTGCYKIFGFSITATRGVSLVSVMGLAALAYLVLRQSGTTRVVAGGLMALFLTHPLMIWLARSGRPDGFALGAGFAAILWLGARPQPRLRDWGIAGLLIGIGGLFHIMVLSWAPALAAATCWRTRRIAWGGGAILAITAAAPVVAWIAWAFAIGDGDAWLEQFWGYQIGQRVGSGAWWVRPGQEFLLFASQFKFQPLAALAIAVGVASACFRAHRLENRAVQVGLGCAFGLIALGTAKGTGMYSLYWYSWAILAAGAGFAAMPPRLAKSILLLGICNGLIWHGGLQGIAWYQREARDPSRVDAFFAQHLPAGSVVIGPEDIWYAVESADSELRIWVKPAEVAHEYLVTHTNEATPAPTDFALVAELPDIMPKVMGRYFSHTSCSYRLWKRLPKPNPPPSRTRTPIVTLDTGRPLRRV